MLTRPALALTCVALLAACGGASESRLNPLNWFGRSQTVEVSSDVARQTDGRSLISQVVALRAEPVPGGAILRATGVPPRQGYFNGELVAINGEGPRNGVLAYEFRIASPGTQTRVGPAQSREVIVGRFVSEQTLQGVRQIRVQGASNALVVRR